jgi:hypothetical protein
LAKVIAVNDVGPSVESAEGGSAKIITSPEPPTLVATSMVNGNVNPVVHITFVPPSYDGGSVISGYKYFIKPITSNTYREVESFNQVTDH